MAKAEDFPLTLKIPDEDFARLERLVERFEAAADRLAAMTAPLEQLEVEWPPPVIAPSTREALGREIAEIVVRAERRTVDR